MRRVSAAHMTSLSTIAGITAVIALLLAASVAQGPGAVASFAFALASTSLYGAREAACAALDAADAPAVAEGAGFVALRRYHLGMAALYAGLGAALAGRLTGLAAWGGLALAPFVLGALARSLRAGARARSAERRRAAFEAEAETGKFYGASN